MDQRLVARKVARLRLELARLRAGCAPQRHRRAECRLVRGVADELDEHALAVLRIVPINHVRLLEIHDHEIEVAIAIEIRVSRAVADTHMIQPPRLAHILEVRSVRVAKRAMPFAAHLALLEKVEHVPPAQHVHRHELVRVVHVPRDAVRAIHVQPAVVVEIGELHRPRPVRARKPVEPRALAEMALARVQQQHVLHVLRRLPRDRPFQINATHHAHRRRRLEMRRHRHVAHQEIREPIVVDVSKIRAHRKPRRVRKHLRRDIRERAVAVVPVKFVRRDEIVGHVNVRAPVPVEIPHRHRKPVAPPRNARGICHILETRRAVRPVSFIVEKPVRRPDGFRAPVVVVVAPHGIVFFRLRLDRNGPVRVLDDRHFLRRPVRVLDPVRQQIHVEPPVPVVIEKHRAVAAIHRIDPRRLPDFLEHDRLAFRPRPHVQEKLIRHHVAAHVNIGPPVPVHVPERRPGTPTPNPFG